jgi:site-specific DNA-methyltransferase (adenine-specific)
MLNKIILGDCLEVMKQIPDKSIDMVLCDLPYGITSCRWDSVLPVFKLWEQYPRICSGAIVLTASQPFTSALVMSNPVAFKHEWIWIKNRGSNFANTVREPMKEHESVLVFAYDKWTYNKQMQERTGTGGDRVKYGVAFKSKSENYREFEGRDHFGVVLNKRFAFESMGIDWMSMDELSEAIPPAYTEWIGKQLRAGRTLHMK